MVVLKKLLKNRNGDIIIPVVDVLNYLYPVGSIYMSATMSTVAEVETAFGGTWVAWGAGRVPLGMGSNGTTNYTTVERTGGSEVSTYLYSPPVEAYSLNNGGGAYADRLVVRNPGLGNSSEISANISLMQPYITCYMYKRTA